MQRSSFDFDVITGPSTRQPAISSPTPARPPTPDAATIKPQGEIRPQGDSRPRPSPA